MRIKTLMIMLVSMFLAVQVFAPSAHATATYSAVTDLTISATATDVTGVPAVDVSAEAVGTNFFLDEQANDDATAIAGADGADGVPVDLLGQSFQLTASVNGQATNGSAQSTSLNGFDIFLTNLGQTNVDVLLTFDWNQLVAAATQSLGELANAWSVLSLFDNPDNPPVLDLQLPAFGENGSSQSDSSGSTLQLSYLLGPGGQVSLFGSVDAYGGADTTNAVVPEPSTFLLLGAGIAGLALWRKKRF